MGKHEQEHEQHHKEYQDREAFLLRIIDMLMPCAYLKVNGFMSNEESQRIIATVEKLLEEKAS